MMIDWINAPKWAVDVRDVNSRFGLSLIFTNGDKRYCDINFDESDFDTGDKDYIGIIHSSRIISVRPTNA